LRTKTAAESPVRGLTERVGTTVQSIT